MFAQQFMIISFRTIAGVIMGVLLGAGGYFFGFLIWWAIPFDLRSAIPFLVSFAGAGGMLGAFVGWLRPDAGRTAILLGLALALVGGIAGAWGGFLYGEVAYTDVVPASGGAWGGVIRVLSVEIDRPTASAIFIGAGLGGNLLPMLNGLSRAWRYLEV